MYKSISRKRKSLLPVLVMLLFTAFYSSLNAQISVVVSSSSNHKASDTEIKNIFTGNLTAWPDGAKITVVDQPDNETGKTFYESFIGIAVSQVRVKWTKLVLSGAVMAPKKLNNDNEVKAEVSKDVNAVGFISSASLDNSVKEIYRVK